MSRYNIRHIAAILATHGIDTVWRDGTLYAIEQFTYCCGGQVRTGSTETEVEPTAAWLRWFLNY